MHRPAMWNRVFAENRGSSSLTSCSDERRGTSTRAFALAQDDTPWILLGLKLAHSMPLLGFSLHCEIAALVIYTNM